MLPEVPTVEQAGISPFDIGTWFGVFTTAGTSPAVVQILHDAYEKALLDPDVIERLSTMGSNQLRLSTAQFTAMIRQELEKYKEIVKISGAQVN